MPGSGWQWPPTRLEWQFSCARRTKTRLFARPGSRSSRGPAGACGSCWGSRATLLRRSGTTSPPSWPWTRPASSPASPGRERRCARACCSPPARAARASRRAASPRWPSSAPAPPALRTPSPVLLWQGRPSPGAWRRPASPSLPPLSAAIPLLLPAAPLRAASCSASRPRPSCPWSEPHQRRYRRCLRSATLSSQSPARTPQTTRGPYPPRSRPTRRPLSPERRCGWWRTRRPAMPP
mmetsp:Transcript_14995/g.56504  ORF Transcript_14995/g.56504 Transcript_14995/m.56504 type:complete len:237 (-) Transcript_14995:263-973(-)